MRSEIINKTNFLRVPDRLREIIPYKVYDSISKLNSEKLLEEIRLRKNKNCYIVASGENISLDVSMTENDMENVVSKISAGSLYAHKDTIINGYISFNGGIRIGVVGRAGIDNERIIGIYDISELVIRIPNHIKVSTGKIYDLIKENKSTHGILLYSPPGVGKTTLLRELINEVSKEFRTCVIDTRGEFEFGLRENGGYITMLSHYPKKLGIEIATRTMNAQIIVCDEIGDETESRTIISAHACGIPLVASCHGSSFDEIIHRPGIALLHKEHIFDYYVGIERDEKNGFIYNVRDWRASNDSI